MSGGFLTPKAIANRIKAKGLQKLRWYCQMCEKQCRDENGFKCHAQSEGHLRNMQLYAQNPRKFKEKFSSEFENSFLKELSRRHHTNTIKANTFYSEYISDKEHLHMNATRWSSLTEFVKDLGRRGLIRVEEKEEGFFISFIDRSANATETDDEKAARREKTILDDAERDRVRAEALRRAAAARAGPAEDVPVSTELHRDDGDAPLGFAFVAPAAPAVAPNKRDVVSAFGDDNDDGAAQHGAAAPVRPKSALEDIYEREQARRKRQARDQSGSGSGNGSAPAAAVPRGWLVVGIDVKCRNKALADGEYYNKKGHVTAVHEDGTVADVEMRDSGDVIRVAAQHLETVLPQPGGHLLVVRGHWRGKTGTLVQLNVEAFSATLKLDDGAKNNITLPYEDVCKYANRK